MPHRASMRIYFVLNALSLFWAATDLLLVLVFLLPGKIRQFRGSDQVSGQAPNLTTLECMTWRLCCCICGRAAKIVELHEGINSLQRGEHFKRYAASC